MLHINPMPNPILEAIRAYKMTTLGKIVVGSTIAEAILSSVQMPTQQVQQQPVQHMNTEQEAWCFYGEILKSIQKTNNGTWWNNTASCMKKKYLVAICLKEDKGHLVPYFQKNIFPTL